MPLEIPHNREAEEALLGAVFINPDIYIDLSQFLTADDFYIVRHKWIWGAFDSLQHRRVPIDQLTVATELENDKLLADVGGTAYLTGLLAQVPTSLNAMSYGHMVEAMAIRRRLLNSANSVATLAYDMARPVEEIVADSAAELQAAISSSKTDSKTILQLVDEHKAKITTLSSVEDASYGLLFKLPDVDKKLGFGVHKKCIMIAGRPGVGKSSLGFQVSLEAMKQGLTAAIFSLEMDSESAINVLMSMMTQIDSQRLELGKLTPEEWGKYEGACAVMAGSKNRLVIDDNPSHNISTIRSRCLSIKASQGLDLVVVDYLMRIQGYKTLDSHDRANMLSLDLFELNRELGTSMIIIHHMNRAFEHRTDGIPVLSDLNEGGERDPDIIMFLTPDKETSQIGSLVPVNLSFVKHRHGPMGVVPLLFQPETTTFKQAATKWLSLK